MISINTCLAHLLYVKLNMNLTTLTNNKELTKMNTTEKLENNPSLKQSARSARRRHWHDFEKLAIVQKYDNKEFYPVKGDPTSILDPKSGEALEIKLIEQWRAMFQAHGLLPRKESKIRIETFKPALKEQAKPVTKTPFGSEEVTAKDIILDLVKENQVLRAKLAELANSDKKSPK